MGSNSDDEPQLDLTSYIDESQAVQDMQLDLPTSSNSTEDETSARHSNHDDDADVLVPYSEASAENTDNKLRDAAGPNEDSESRSHSSPNSSPTPPRLTLQLRPSNDAQPRSLDGAEENGENDNDAANCTPHQIPDMDWSELYERFESKMAEKRQEEEAIQAEVSKLQSFYNVWLATSAFQEEQRAAKRLRTRIAHVRNSEAQLWEKRQHHENVVKAFQDALSLLSGD